MPIIGHKPRRYRTAAKDPHQRLVHRPAQLKDKRCESIDRRVSMGKFRGHAGDGRLHPEASAIRDPRTEQCMGCTAAS